MLFSGLRNLFDSLDDALYRLAVVAVQVVDWDRMHQFCGRCGEKTEYKEGVRAKACPRCGLVSFPRISPAVIVAVERDNKLLLARASRFPTQFYSVLAGFVEPGETLEEAVAREVKEEVGIELANISYFGSQPWPFPDSLMIGFTAQYAGGEICIDESEIVDAGWFEANELPTLPGKISIARQLIDWFVVRKKPIPLSSGCAGTGIDHVWGYIPAVHEPMGWTLEDLIEDHTQIIARGLIDKELLYLVASEAYDRVLDLEKFGVNFRYKDSKAPGKFRIVTQFHSVPTTWNFDGVDIKIKLTREAKRRGVTIINRVMVTDLLKTDSRIAGAVGVDTRNGKQYLFKAKAVVVSTGRVNRLSRTVTGVWGNHRVPVNETGDGRAMALRAGVPIINMEFFTPPVLFHRQLRAESGLSTKHGPAGRFGGWPKR